MLRYAKTRPAPPIKERYIAYKEPYITPKEPYLRFCRAQGSRGSGWGRCRVRDLVSVCKRRGSRWVGRAHWRRWGLEVKRPLGRWMMRRP